MQKATLWLMMGYCAGQGSALLIQLISKYLGLDETTGLIVIVISLFSFCFQFSEMGNTTYLMKKVYDHQFTDVERFISYRSLVGFVICGAFSFYTYNFGVDLSLLLPIFICIPLLGFLFGRFNLVYSESKNKYFFLATSNAACWVVLSAALTIYLFPNDIPTLYASFSVVTFVIFIAVVILFKSNRDKPSTAESLDNSNDTKKETSLRVLQFLMPQLSSQIWGRTILFIVAANYGLALLGLFGIVKYAQVFLSLFVVFITRPLLRTFIANCSSTKEKPEAYALFKHYNQAFYISLLGPILYLLAKLYELYIGSEFAGGWALVLCIIPFSLISKVCTQVNQLTLSSKVQIIVDHLGLLGNILVFFVFLDFNPVYAVFLGELTQHLFNIIIHKPLQKVVSVYE